MKKTTRQTQWNEILRVSGQAPILDHMAYVWLTMCLMSSRVSNPPTGTNQTIFDSPYIIINHIPINICNIKYHTNICNIIISYAWNTHKKSELV